MVVYEINDTSIPTDTAPLGFLMALPPPIAHIASEPQVIINETMFGKAVEIFADFKSTPSHSLLYFSNFLTALSSPAKDFIILTHGIESAKIDVTADHLLQILL